MKNIQTFVETLGNIREGNTSAAKQGFETAFLAWLTAPQNLDYGQILKCSLASSLEPFTEKLSIATGNTYFKNIDNTNLPEADFVRFIQTPKSENTYPDALLYIDKHRKEISHIFNKIHNLKRSGWLARQVSRPESVAEHSFSLAVSALLLAPQHINHSKIAAMALIHDIQEISTGDYTLYDNISPQEKGRLELQAARQISKMLHKPEMLELFIEYEKSSTPESRFVKDVDRLDAVLLAAYYDKHHRVPKPLLPEFIANAEKKYLGGYACETVKNIYAYLKKEKIPTIYKSCANRE